MLRPPTTRARRPWMAWGGIALLASGCGAEAVERPVGPGRTLLAVEPHERIDQPGTLRPSEQGPWAHGEFSGWEPETTRHEEHVVAWTTSRAQLLLPASEPRERVLEIEALAPDGPEAPALAVEIRLNGLRLGREELAPGGPEVLRVTAPEEHWIAGVNALELRVRAPDGGMDGNAGIGVLRVSYDRPRRLRFDGAGDGLHFPSGTGARWLLEPSPGARLHLRASATGTGRLRLALAALDPRDGRRESLEVRELSVEAKGDGEVRAVHPLLDTGGAPLVLELVWTPTREKEAELHLRELRLEEPARGPRPSIVLISVDTLAARHLSIHGYPRETCPNLAALAEDAVVFERCSSNAPWTLPSHLSMFTGLFAGAHLPASKPDEPSGESGKADIWDLLRLDTERWSLAEMLRGSGHRTAAFVDAIWLRERFGFRQGFERFDTSAADLEESDPRGGIEHILPRVADWLESLHPEEPFFLFLHCFDVHGPFRPARPWAGRFGDDELTTDRRWPAGTSSRAYGAIPRYIAWSIVPDGEIPPTLPEAPIVAGYDEEILAVDDALGRLLELLEQERGLDEVMVIVTADHGELLGEHERFGHGQVWEPVTHVPLLIKPAAGEGTERAGRRVTGSVQTVDLYPTLRALLELPGPREPLHGRSLVPALRGEPLEPVATYTEAEGRKQSAIELDGWKLVETWPERGPAIELLTSPRLPDGWLAERLPGLEGPLTPDAYQRHVEENPERRSLLAEARRCLAGPVHELFHLPSDPGEERDLAAAEPERLADLLRRLGELQSLTEEARIERQPLTQRAVTEDELGRLRNLGYAGD